MRGRTLTLEVTEKRGKAAKTIPLYQYDYGQKLLIEGVELPEYYEVHFSNQQYGDAVTVLGDSTGVLIPDSLVATGESIYVWLYLHDTSYDGETEYMGVIPVIKRAEPSDITPTPEEQSIITEVIAALNNMEDDMSDQVNEAKAAKEAAEDAQAGAEAAESAVEGYASAAEAAKEAAETAQTAAETAQAAAEAASNAAITAYNNADSARSSAVSAKEYAETAATNASTSATSASGYATNAQNSASSALDAQAAAETAQGKAEDAQTAAETAQAAAEAAEDGVEADALIAEGYAVGKQNGEDVASGSTYYHNNAKYYADAASDSATAAAGSEENAEDSAEDAEAYAVGTRDGVDVESDDPAYENNAKYYAEQAAAVLEDKLDAPATAGTAGQVLTSDGEGGQAWADPSGAIDDTAGEGDTDVTWSADKLDGEFTDVLTAIEGISTDVSFLENYITPQMKGAKADGLTDDTTAINAAAAEAIEKGMMLYIPQGQYKCESGLNLRYVKRIRSEGVITLTTDNTWVTVGDSSVNGIFCDIHIASATRVKVVGLLDSKVYVGYAQELMLYADGEDDDGHAVAYNTLQGEFVSKITLMSNKESETVGWVNDNLFEFRRIIHILIDGNYKHNNNVFRNCGIEGNAATIDIPMGHSNKIICRGESLPLTNITIGADCFNNQILKSWGNPGLTGGYLDHMIGIQRKNYYGMIWDQLRTYYSIINIDRNHKCFSGMQGYLDDNGKMYAYSGQTFVKVDKYVIPNASQVEVVLSASDARFSLKNVQLHGADGTALQLSASIVEGGGINSYYGQTTAQFTSGAYRLLNFTITDPATVRYISFELITTSGYSGNFEFVTVKFVTNKIFTYNPIMAPIEIKSYANAAPLRGNWEVGEIVYNASPAPGGYVGWICTTAGKSGTWKGFGLIEA